MYTRKRLVNLEILVQMIVFLKCAQVLIFPWFGCVRLIELQPKNCRCRVYVEIYIKLSKGNKLSTIYGEKDFGY